MLAKAVASLDVLSGGRFDLGIGVGWLEEEFDALGIPFGDRGARTDDYVAAMRALWSDDNTSHEGPFTSFADVTTNPKPVNGSVPIVVGGHSKAAARRAGRLGDGFFPGRGSPAELAELIDVVRQSAADAGRDPESVEITAPHAGLFGDDPVAAAEELAAIGVTRTIVPAFLLARGDVAEAAAGLAQKVLDPCAAI